MVLSPVALRRVIALHLADNQIKYDGGIASITLPPDGYRGNPSPSWAMRLR